MKRTTVYFGEQPSPTPRLLARDYVAGRGRPLWPSVFRDLAERQPRGSLIDPLTPLIDSFPSKRVNGRAVSLAPDGDVDELLVFFDDSGDPEFLGPGQIIRRDFTEVRIEPARAFPSTKATSLPSKSPFKASQGLKLPNHQFWHAEVFNDTGGHWQFRLVLDAADGPVQTYKWNGVAWVADAVIAIGGQWIPTGGNVSTPLTDGTGADAHRLCDYTPVGPGLSCPQLNFVELLLGAVITVQPASAHLDPVLPNTFNLWRDYYFECSVSAADSNGLPGQGILPSANPYHSPYTRYVEDSWPMCAGLVVYDECPGAGERAVLLPERRYVFADYTIAYGGALPASNLGDVLITFPTMNIDRVQFIGGADAGNGGNIYAALMFRKLFDEVETVANVGQQSPSPAVAAAAGGTIAIAANVEDFMCSFMSVGLGADAAGYLLSGGSELVLRRKNIGG